MPRVKFTMTVNPDDSDAGVMPTLSVYFEAKAPDVDYSSQSEEEGEEVEGDSAGEGEDEDASSVPTRGSYHDIGPGSR
jgi:hypothetical protein